MTNKIEVRNLKKTYDNFVLGENSLDKKGIYHWIYWEKWNGKDNYNKVTLVLNKL